MVLQDFLITRVYADQSSSPQVRRALERCLAGLSGPNKGLQVGAGTTQMHPNVLNVDVSYNSNLDCCANADRLPFRDETFAVVLSQETLEHVQGLAAAVREMYRVTAPGGLLYCQVPFVIGYHPGPTDFWRFSKEGIREIFEQAGYAHEETGISAGPCAGFYRVAVEFGAIVLSRFVTSLYKPMKALLIALLYPVKVLDRLMITSPQADRIAGGYYVIMRKVVTS